MRIPFGFSFRIALLYFLLLGGLFWFILHKALDTLDSSVRQAAEDVLVDSANLLAEQVSQHLDEGRIDVAKLRKLVRSYLQREINASIYSVFKSTPDMQVYLTDKNGMVLFDSSGRHEGDDFSQWRDVWLTLRGFYGARASAIDAATAVATPAGRAIYVAAPVLRDASIVGVLTLSKEIRHLDPFIIAASRQLQTYAIVVLLIALAFSVFVAWWLSGSIRKLVVYADKLAEGRRVTAPRLREHEFNRLSSAMEKMQRDLEGKRYVEEYVQTLAHELKSPLSSIHASAELLQEKTMSLERRRRFAASIQESSQRMTELTERLLALASLEQQRSLEQFASFDISEFLDEQLSERASLIQAKNVVIEQRIQDRTFAGDVLLIRQAVSNLLDNALDFSPIGGRVEILTCVTNKDYCLEITDQGPGIPAYALEKIFHRFYSLPRPSDRKRSTGLGLSFVLEVMNLHQGEAVIKNYSEGGVSAKLRWPKNST